MKGCAGCGAPPTAGAFCSYCGRLLRRPAQREIAERMEEVCANVQPWRPVRSQDIRAIAEAVKALADHQ